MKALIALLCVIGVLVVLVAGIMLAPSLIDWNAFKPDITEAIERKTGHRISIDGDLEVRLLPVPGIVAHDVTVLNGDGAHGADRLTVGRLRADLRVGPLLRGSLDVSAISLFRPALTIERLAAAGEPGASGGSPGPGSGPVSGFGISDASVTDGTVLYRDLLTGREYRVDRLNASLKSEAPGGPYRLTGTLAWQDEDVEVSVILNRLDARRVGQLEVEAAMAQSGSAARFSGRAHLGPAPALHGELTVRSGDPAAVLKPLLAALGTEPAPLPPGLPDLQLAASLSLDADRFTATDLAITFGDARLDGEIGAALVPEVRIDAHLELGRMDLGSLNDAAGRTAAVAAALFGSRPASEGPGGAFALPLDIGARLNFEADVLDIGDDVVRQVRLEGELADGAVTVRHLAAQLPGGTNAVLAGTLHPEAGKPRFIGTMDIASDNLRALLAWLQIPVEAVPSDRLRTSTYRSGIDATPDQVKLTEWDILIDSTRIGGGVVALLGERRSFGLGLNIDRITLDPYLAPASPATGAAQPGAESGAAAEPWLDELLAAFDANIWVQVGEAALRGHSLQGITIDGTLVGGRMTLREGSIGNFAEGSYTLTGTMVGADPDTADLSLTVENGSAVHLARLLDVALPAPLGTLDRFSGRGDIAGSDRGFGITADISTGGGTLDVAGTVVPATPPEFSLTMEAAHPAAETVIGQLFDIADTASLPSGPGRMTLSLASRIDTKVEVTSKLEFAAGRIEVDGVTNPFAAVPELDVRVHAVHPDVAHLLRSGEADPASPGPGALDLEARLTGTTETFELHPIDIRVGTTDIGGSGRVDLTGARPAVALSLSSGPLVLDHVLPAAESAPVPPVAVPASPPAPGPRGWSREPVDLAAFRSVDLELKLRARQVVHTPYVLDGAVLDASLVDGVLDIAQLTGRLFGGEVKVSGRLATPGTPNLDVAVAIEGADLGAVAAATAGGGPLRGLLNHTAQLSGRGRSEFELISSLRGNGTVSVSEGAVHGIDLPAVSARLHELDRAVDFLTLIREALTGGMTPIQRLGGSFTIRDGILRSDDLVLQAPAASGRVMAAINLPEQQVDVQSRFWLTDHPNSPPIGVRHVGPLHSPRTELDVDRMQAHILQRIVRRGILRQLKTESDESRPQRGEGARGAIRSNLQSILEGLRQ